MRICRYGHRPQLTGVCAPAWGKTSELAQIIAPFEGTQGAHLRFYDVQPVGRAQTLPLDALRTEVTGFCSACAAPAITDDGRLTACNGPSYFASLASPLQVGSLRHVPLRVLLERHQQDPILDTIRTSGPSRLREELQQMLEFATFPFRQRYHGLCDLCHHITSSPEAVSALRRRLAHPRCAAEREAAWRVMVNSRKDGSLTRWYVNGIGACRVFLQAAADGENRWMLDTEKILGRADLDWHHVAAYVTACGLARPLLATLADATLTRWAPRSFADRVRTRAMQDSLRELVQRETLCLLRQALQAGGGKGGLLKGGALLALSGDGKASPPQRATGDIDIYVEPALAETVRRTLIGMGFRGAIEASRTAPHHLASVSFQGVAVEIHTRLLPTFWGLPESAILTHAQPVPEMEPLYTLDATGFLLHAGMHATTHLFSYGLKTAWDLRRVVTSGAAIDWDRLAAWVALCRIPRGFWVPVRVLCQELALPLPAEFLAGAPADVRQQKLELIARHRLFSTIEEAFAMNPFSKNAVFLLLHDSWIGRARYLVELSRGTATEARRSARRSVPAQAFKQVPQQLRQALIHWRQYRHTWGTWSNTKSF